MRASAPARQAVLGPRPQSGTLMGSRNASRYSASVQPCVRYRCELLAWRNQPPHGWHWTRSSSGSYATSPSRPKNGVPSASSASPRRRVSSAGSNRNRHVFGASWREWVVRLIQSRDREPVGDDADSRMESPGCVETALRPYVRDPDGAENALGPDPQAQQLLPVPRYVPAEHPPIDLDRSAPRHRARV
jgi:hypothetical protein